jgi:hypothetical protein
LESEEKFEDILVKTGGEGQLVFMRDIVRDTRVGITLDPAKLAAHRITPDEVAQVLKEASRRVEFQTFGASPPPAALPGYGQSPQ